MKQKPPACIVFSTWAIIATDEKGQDHFISAEQFFGSKGQLAAFETKKLAQKACLTLSIKTRVVKLKGLIKETK